MLLSYSSTALAERAIKPKIAEAPDTAQNAGEGGEQEVSTASEHDPVRRGLGIDPSSLQVGDLILPAGASLNNQPSASESMEFRFRGFMRIPVRFGFGSGAGHTTPGTKVHVPPIIPDGNYSDWRYTNNLTGPWTELFFTYGNARAAANVSIAAYDVTGASYRDPQAQLGINHAFVSLNYSDLFGSRGGLIWNVGAFSNRYGAPGRYSGGKYETYLFGATHTAGETVAAFYDLNSDFTLQVEHGVGAKLNVVPFQKSLREHDQAHKDLYLDIAGLPYGGEEQQGTTLVHHGHVGVTYQGSLTAAFHYMTSWNDDARAPGELDGQMTSFGGELKLTGHRFGDGYIGFGQLKAENVGRLSNGIELLHSGEGWNLRNNYFGSESSGSGKINTLLFQHTFSLSRFLWHPKPFWGQAPDLNLSIFGMYNHVTSTDSKFSGAKDKLKYGAEVTYTPLSWLGVSGRYDLVQPDMDNSNLSFTVISPKLIIRTSFVSHEQIIIQYTRYIYGEDVVPGWPHDDGSYAADENVIKISAVMWW